MSETKAPKQKETSIYRKEGVEFFLAIIATLGFFVLTGIIIFVDIPEKGSERDLIMSLFGILQAVILIVFNFYFGSSRSSRGKDQAAAERQGPAPQQLV